MGNEIPLHWAAAMERANITHPRTGRASMRGLAEKSGEAPETIRRMVRGMGNPQPTTVQSVADALGVNVRTVANWVGHVRVERDRFVPHADADLMTDAERKAINQMIRLLTEGRRSAVAPPATRSNRKAAR